jgi:flagellin-specific chaperone FliS
MTLAAYTGGGLAQPAASTLGANALSLMLVNGAMQCIDVARECIERGHDPRRHLRSAVLRVRELPAMLGMCTKQPLAVNFADLCEYICRQLNAVGDEGGLPRLDESCDLLREICRAWVTLPTAGVTLAGASQLTAQI